MTKKKLEIHSENLLPIIKKWLYSDKDIFARELVSNACDAIHKVKILRDKGEVKTSDEEFRIDIRVNKEKGTLQFIDTGIGLDAEEVEKYISQIAFSSAEEFLEKYKTNQEGDQFIGHFGLGFYSAYMVAEKVEIETLSYKEGAEPVFWSCDGSSEYNIEKGSRKTRGTEITLFVEKGNEEFLEEFKLKQILEHYCAFLPYPVYLGENRINTHEPLWVKKPSECTEKDYLEFYRHLYPMQEDPLFWMHLNVDYPFHLKGILYFPKLQREFDINKNSIRLFCNRVFVSDNCKDVIPNYLMVLQGVIDSPDIPLNVSRSTLQMDRTVRQLSGHISKKVSDSLTTLYRTNQERYYQCWEDVSPIIKLGAMEDEKFYDRVKNLIIWKNVGGEWTTIEDYLERNKEKTKDKVLYTKDDKQLSHFLDIYKQKNIEVVCAPSPLDTYLIQFLETKIAPAKFQRIDAEIDENILDKDREKTVLDSDGKTEAGKLADFVRSKIEHENIEVEAKSLATDRLPGFVVFEENQRRMRDYMRSLSPKDAPQNLSQLTKQTFVVNTNSPLMSVVQELDKANPELTKEIINEIYDLSLLSQREMDPTTLNDFIHRSNTILEKLATQVVKKGK
ncbi:MAG: Chaperone protein HtpG [Chlamydiae bacterium]|nr:Chaperone protein HtpG [Chlamydiota bacterium]